MGVLRPERGEESLWRGGRPDVWPESVPGEVSWERQGPKQGASPASQAGAPVTSWLVGLSGFHTWWLFAAGKNSCPRSKVQESPRPSPADKPLYVP